MPDVSPRPNSSGINGSMYDLSISSFDNVIASFFIVHGVRTNDGAWIRRRWIQTLGPGDDLLGWNYLARRHRDLADRFGLIPVNRAFLNVRSDRNFNPAHARAGMVCSEGHRDNVLVGITA